MTTSPLARFFFRGKHRAHNNPSGPGSGPGSSLRYTEGLRARLPHLLAGYRVKTLLDAPCGELNWILDCDLGIERYIGMDIAPDIIAHNQARGLPGREFLCADITRAALPGADMMLCRDCLFHLPHADIWRFFRNFAGASIPWLLTSSHLSPRNVSVETPGDFRFLNLLIEPFKLPPPREVLPDYLAHNKHPRFLFLWSRAEIIGWLAKADLGRTKA